MFKVCYNPNPFPVQGEHVLHEWEERNDAVVSAIEYAKMYGPTWVKKGRKIVFRSND